MERAASITTAATAGMSKEPGTTDSNGAHMFVFTNAKSGMKNVDKERVNRIIYEMSKNSSYFKQAQLQDDKLDSKVCMKSQRLRSTRLTAVLYHIISYLEECGGLEFANSPSRRRRLVYEVFETSDIQQYSPLC